MAGGCWGYCDGALVNATGCGGGILEYDVGIGLNGAAGGWETGGT